MTPFEIQIEKIEELTDWNNHGEAIIEGAKMVVGGESIISTVTAINEEHMKIGYLAPGLSIMRREQYEKLMRFARAQFTDEQYKAFRMAY